MLWLTALAIVALSVVAFFLPKRMLPLGYLLWATAFIQATAVFYFTLFPNRFPHDLPSYISTMMTSGLVLISFVPVLLAFTYYFLEPSIPKKLLLTCLTMAHLSLFVPLQYMLQAYLIHKFSLLFMPVLYILFGLFLDVFILIAFYSWAVSWSGTAHARKT
jgi:hypothetical protein